MIGVIKIESNTKSFSFFFIFKISQIILYGVKKARRVVLSLTNMYPYRGWIAKRFKISPS